MEDLRKRHGKFTVKMNKLDSLTDLIAITKDIAVVRCEHLYHNNLIEYIGYSNKFDVVEQGMETPRYRLIDNRKSCGPDFIFELCNENQIQQN